MNDTPLEWQMWTAKGYAVLLPDFRSTAEYGLSAFRKMAKERDIWFHGDEIDLLNLPAWIGAGR